MNEIEIQRLAAATHQLRPDWPIASLRTLIAGKLTAHAWRDAAIALVFVATDPNSRTPARVLEPGPWWQATTAVTAEPTPMPQFDFEAHRKARHRRTPSEAATAAIAAARRAIHDAKART